MEIIRSLNRSWIYDTYLSLYEAIHPGEKSGGKCPGENVRGEMSRYANYRRCRDELVLMGH